VEEIQQIFEDHFQGVFTIVGYDPFREVALELVCQVVPQRFEALERSFISKEIMLDELEMAMKDLKNDKSLVLDGFLIEFYKHVVCVVPCLFEDVLGSYQGWWLWGSWLMLGSSNSFLEVLDGIWWVDGGPLPY
jgi:hypothetical protein